MADKIINNIVIDNQPGKFYAPNVLTGLEETEAVSELKENLNDTNDKAEYGNSLYTDIINGNVTGTGGATTNTKRIRTKDIFPVKKGDVVYINSGSFYYGFEIWVGTLTAANRVRHDDCSCPAGTDKVRFYADGYCCIVFRKADNTDVDPATFDGEIRIYSQAIEHNINDISALQSFLMPVYPDIYYFEQYGTGDIGDTFGLASSVNLNIEKFTVDADTKYCIQTMGRPTTVNYIVWVDSNNIILQIDGFTVATAGQIVSGDFVSPSNAAYVYISATKNAAVGGATIQYIQVYKVLQNEDVTNLKTNVYEYINPELQNGYRVYNDIIQGNVTGAGVITTNDKRIRTKDVFPVKAGDVVFVDSGSLYYGFEIWHGALASGNRKRDDQTYCPPGTEYCRMIADGYCCVVFRKADSSTIVPSEFTGEIRIYSHELREQEEQIEALQTLSTPVYPIEAVYDKYYTGDVGSTYTTGSSANFNGMLFPIEGGKTYRLETIGRTATELYFIWIDENGIILSVDGKAPSANGYPVVETYMAPSTAAYVAINATKNTPVGGQTTQYIKVYKSIVENIRGYYADEMKKTIGSVRDSVTEPALIFPIVTDIHYLSMNETFNYCVDNIKEFCKHIKCDFLLNLGDNTDGDTAQDITLSRAYYMATRFNEINLPLYMAIGNHDTNYFNGAPIFNSNQIFKAYLPNTRGVNYDLTAGEKNYYVDFPELGIRLVVLDADHNVQYAFSARTATWLSTVALDTDYIVIAAMHLSPIGNQNWNAQTPDYGADVKAALQGFVDDGGTLIQLCGHSHADYYCDTPWLVIYNACQKSQQADVTGEGYQRITGAASTIVAPERTPNTETEDLWTVCVVKPISRTVDMIRFGAGVDRTFSF